jgi:hypothetical protein
MKPLLVLLSSILLGISANAQVNTFEIDSSKFNRPLMIILDSLYKADQGPRLEYFQARNNKANAKTIDSLTNLMHQHDQENIKKVDAIIAEYGWLSPQKVGYQASLGLFLIIQHADIATQERFLPLIQAAEKKGETTSSNVAILEDRINVRRGRKQDYGSQGFTDKQSRKMFIYPISDPDRLEDRRKAMGLIPMKEYVKSMNLEWDLDAYKKSLPELDKIVARQKP